jgi:hypothetical protein
VPYLQADSPDELRDRIRDEEALTPRQATGQERQRDEGQPIQGQIPEQKDC